MKLVPVDELPKERRPVHKLQKLIKEFCDGDNKIVKIDLDSRDYQDVQSAYSSLYKAAKFSKRPVKVHKRGDEIYLTKL
jgi:hypothetical protein